MLRLQKFVVDIRYKKSLELYLADTLSRAYQEETEELSDFCHTLTGIDQKQNIGVGDALLEEIRIETCQDCTIQEVKNVVMTEWPSSHEGIPKSGQLCFGCRVDLKLCDDFVMESEAVVVPEQLRVVILGKVHDTSHVGIEACLRRARRIFYWPEMAKEIHDYVMSCAVCQRNKHFNNGRGRCKLTKFLMHNGKW